MLFPEEGQDVEFIEDVMGRLPPEQQERAFSAAWTRPVRKPDAQGIHGTLFYELDYKKEYYPSKRESDVYGPPHSPAVWLLVPEVGLSDTPGEDAGESSSPEQLTLLARLPRCLRAGQREPRKMADAALPVPDRA